MAARKKTAAAEAAEVERNKPKERKVGFISAPLDDVREQKPAPEGEYDLKILKAVDGKSKKGTRMATITIVFTDPEVDAPPFQLYLRDPGDIEDPDQARMASLEAKRFQEVVGLQDGWDADELPGEEFTCFVGQETGEDDVVRNRLRLPRLKD